MKNNKSEIEQIAFDCVYGLSALGCNHEEADFYSLSHEDTVKMAQLIHEDSPADERHESLSSGDSFDCYGTLIFHNPNEFIRRIQYDLIEYYRDAIDEKIHEAIHRVNQVKQEQAMVNFKSRSIFSGASA